MLTYSYYPIKCECKICGIPPFYNLNKYKIIYIYNFFKLKKIKCLFEGKQKGDRFLKIHPKHICIYNFCLI